MSQLREYEDHFINMGNDKSKAYNYHVWFKNNAEQFTKINIEESLRMSKYAHVKMCYNNCYKLALSRKRLEYVEGLGLSLIPIEHAWLINNNNEVIDPTWGLKRDRIGSEYLGIKIPKNILSKLFNIRSFAPLPYNYWEYLNGELELC